MGLFLLLKRSILLAGAVRVLVVTRQQVDGGRKEEAHACEGWNTKQQGSVHGYGTHYGWWAPIESLKSMVHCPEF